LTIANQYPKTPQVFITDLVCNHLPNSQLKQKFILDKFSSLPDRFVPSASDKEMFCNRIDIMNTPLHIIIFSLLWHRCKGLWQGKLCFSHLVCVAGNNDK
jgi:hypothetical protein